MNTGTISVSPELLVKLLLRLEPIIVSLAQIGRIDTDNDTALEEMIGQYILDFGVARELASVRRDLTNVIEVAGIEIPEGGVPEEKYFRG